MKEKIEQWAADKGIDKPEGVTRQFLKLVEEFGELESGEQESDYDKIRDAIGDLQVVSIIMAKQLGETLSLEQEPETEAYITIHLGKIAEALAKNLPVFPHLQAFVNRLREESKCYYYSNPDICLEEVYAIISKRKGTTVDGVFIKE